MQPRRESATTTDDGAPTPTNKIIIDTTHDDQLASSLYNGEAEQVAAA